MASDVDGLKGLKERIKTNMESRENQKTATDFEFALVDELVEKSKIEYPPYLVTVEVEKMIENQVRQWRNYSRSKEEFEERLKQTATKAFRPSLKSRQKIG